MLSFKELTEKKSKVKINPRKDELMETPKKHPEDCTCSKCENKEDKEGPVVEAKVDAGKSPETKEKDRNVRKFGVSHNVAGHGKLRRALHRSNRGDKKIPGDKPYVEKEEFEFTEEWINAATEIAADYFYAEGLNEDGLDILIDEVGLEDFVEFVIDPIEELNEARSARKAKVSAPSYEKVKAAVDKADAAKKASGKGEYAKSYAKRSGETEDSTNYGDSKKPAAKKKAAAPKKKAAPKTEVKPVAKAAVRKPKAAPAKKAATSKKVAATVAKAKAKQPAKPTSKPGLLGKVKSAVSKGVERHKKAVGKVKADVGKVVDTAKKTAKQHSKHRKDFVKGISPTAKEKKIVKGVGKAVKKSLSREELMMQGLKDQLLEGAWANYVEATRLKKEKGYDKGGTKGKKDPALAAVLDRIRKDHGAGAVIGQGSRQAKKVKGAKSTAGTGKYKKAADAKKQTAADAKKRGFKDVKNYVNTMARYGGKDNYDKGRGLGT